MKGIGFWPDTTEDRSTGDTGPCPIPDDWIDESWDAAERDAVIRYLRAGRTLDWFKGYATCRFHCGIPDESMGSRTLTDGEYCWPEGLAHYLEAHAAKPPESFLEHVRRRLALPQGHTNENAREESG